MANTKAYPGVVGEWDFQTWAIDVRRQLRRQFMSQRNLALTMRRSPALISRWLNLLSMPTIPDYLYVCYMLGLDAMDYIVLPDDDSGTERSRAAARQHEFNERSKHPHRVESKVS